MKAKRILPGILNIFSAIGIVTVWYYVLSQGLFNRIYTIPVEQAAHLLAESLTVILLLWSGIAYLLQKKIANRLYPYALGMLSYTCLHSMGYFLQKSVFTPPLILLVLWILTIIAIWVSPTVKPQLSHANQ